MDVAVVRSREWGAEAQPQVFDLFNRPRSLGQLGYAISNPITVKRNGQGTNDGVILVPCRSEKGDRH